MTVLGYSADGDSKFYSNFTAPWSQAIVTHAIAANNRLSNVKIMIEALENYHVLGMKKIFPDPLHLLKNIWRRLV